MLRSKRRRRKNEKTKQMNNWNARQETGLNI